MIQTKALIFSYPGEEPALSGVDLCLKPGSLTVLAGVNGSGKSTLMHLLAGLYSPGSGSLHRTGEEAVLSLDELRSLARMVVQDADAQVLGATVGEDLCLGLDPRDQASLDRARHLAGRFGLLDHWDRPLQALSWGMKRKLCLATALLDEPRILLLDEPMSGLDYPAVAEMRQHLRENRDQGVTQLVSAHDLEPLADLADDLAVLDQGRLVLFGPPADVLDRVRDHGVRPPFSWQAGLGLQPWDQHRG